MIKSKKLNIMGQVLLFLATLAWGTSFVILKDTISEVPAMFVIAMRFLTAGIILLLFNVKKIKSIDKKTFYAGAIIAVLVAGAYISQTYGLSLTSPGKNAFITSAYSVMCPFIIWILFKQKPTIKNVLSAFICFVGIGLIALSGDKSSGDKTLLGDGLTLISAVFFALQIVFIDRFQRNGAKLSFMLVFEFLISGAIFALVSLVFELPNLGAQSYILNFDQIVKIAYLTLACTLFAQSAQMIGQKYTTPNQSALILSLEAVFGMIFSLIMGVEKLNVMLCVGFAVVFIAIMLSELNFDFSNKRNRIKEISCDKTDNIKE